MLQVEQVLVNFAGFLGLAKVERVDGEKRYIYSYRVRKLPLLDLALRWSISMKQTFSIAMCIT